MNTLDLTLVASAIAAYAVAFSRLADKARWAWAWAPTWAQVALPALVVALPELALALAGVKTWTDFGEALVVAGGAVAAAFRGALPPKTFAKLPPDAKAALRDARTPAADRPLGTRSLTPVRPSDRAPASRSIPPPPIALLLVVIAAGSSQACGLFGGDGGKVPTADELQKACPAAAAVMLVDCPALAIAKCEGATSLAECPAREAVEAECDAKIEAALEGCN